MTSKAQLAIGVDLGATEIAAALVTQQGDIIATRHRPTAPTEGSEAVLANIAATINELLERAPGCVAGAGIGTPGQVDPTSGIIRNAVNLGWREVALASEVQARLTVDIPVHVQNDANAEVLGEAYFGAGRGCKNLVYIGIGSGLGGGAMVNGQLVVGDNLNASEIGHFSLDPDGRTCVCGLRGCPETVLSGSGILAVTLDYLARGYYTTSLTAPSELTPAAVAAAAYAGDPLARAVFAEVARWLGLIIAIYASILNPARIVMGGGLGRATFELLLPGAQAELQRRVLKAGYQHLQIVRSQLASSAVGASCLVWYT